MNCPKCHTTMIISEWDGWVWICVFCGHIDRIATDEEIEDYEKRTYGDK